ncbi:cupin domain-containing protein [Caulobacter zeae]|uniref:Cupin domain-containing protein n=1 Tax=Caulobacter zeae TaxID=2055137 RepID=A0A2N5DRD7_9CAUL|nr:cupin domain-containing protein [Caulobacter zeae]PLR28620.1 cupin domain-containing protein [Caulobacter zeae]
MKGFVAGIKSLAEGNRDFRRVLYTGQHLQLVLMSLEPGDDIGEEVHADHDQFFRIEKGKGEIWINGICTMVRHDDAFIVPAGARHNLVNTGEKTLKVYTIYGPPDHRDGVVRRTKSAAMAEPEAFDGQTSEPRP